MARIDRYVLRTYSGGMDNNSNPGGISKAASKGGKARAAALTPEERSESARRAVEKRWEKEGKGKVPVATHGSPDHPLRIGGIEIPCYVLEGNQRVIVQRGLIHALDMSPGTADAGGEGDRLARFAATKSLNPFISSELSMLIKNPIKFRAPSAGVVSYGYPATVLADICEAVLKARREGKLNHQQEHIAARCEILMAGFARVGIIALVDEATGFQYERPRRDLEEQLKKFLAEGLVRYVSGFPQDYLKHLCRLRGVEMRPDMRLPQYFGHLTNDLVYRRIAPGLLKALKDRRAERGKPGNKLYQWTSEDVGYPALMQHLGSVVMLMTLHTDWDAFKAQLDAHKPLYPEVPGLFDKAEDWQVPPMA